VAGEVVATTAVVVDAVAIVVDAVAGVAATAEIAAIVVIAAIAGSVSLSFFYFPCFGKFARVPKRYFRNVKFAPALGVSAFYHLGHFLSAR
jgi:hypothetical protein